MHASALSLPSNIPVLKGCCIVSCVVVCRYVQALALTQKITKTGVEAAHQLTQGDGRAIRRQLHFLLPYDPALDDLDTTGEMYANVTLHKR